MNISERLGALLDMKDEMDDEATDLEEALAKALGQELEEEDMAIAKRLDEALAKALETAVYHPGFGLPVVDLGSPMEEYEPSPYDGTYSEE